MRQFTSIRAAINATAGSTFTQVSCTSASPSGHTPKRVINRRRLESTARSAALRFYYHPRIVIHAHAAARRLECLVLVRTQSTVLSLCRYGCWANQINGSQTYCCCDHRFDLLSSYISESPSASKASIVRCFSGLNPTMPYENEILYPRLAS